MSEEEAQEPQYRDPLDEVFDAIVVGTGLTEALLAAALARIGKRVLHLDANQHYGDRWAAFTLDSFCEWAEDLGSSVEETKSGDNLATIERAVAKFVGLAKVEGREGVDVVELARGGVTCTVDFCGALLPLPSREELRAEREARERAKQRAQERERKRAEAAAAAAARGALGAKEGEESEGGEQRGGAGTGVKNDEEKKEEGEDAAAEEEQPPAPRPKTLADCAREFNLDLRPALALCKGPMVDVLVSSDVADSVEFVTLEGVFVGLGKGDGGLELIKVPCHKKDVFLNSQLGMAEKRGTMRFMQVSRRSR